MKIIKRQSDNIVLFAGNGLAIEQDGVSGPGWKFRNVDVESLTIEDADNIPEGFVGGGWTFVDSVWTSNSVGDQEILPRKRAKKIIELRQGYVSAVYADIDHAEHVWGADPDSRALLSQVLAVGSVPEGMYWRDSSGIPRSMAYPDLQGLAYAILVRGLAADLNLMTKTASVGAAITLEDIDSIAW